MFNNIKLSSRIIMGILVVEFISIASGIMMGRNLSSSATILIFIAAVVISQIIAWIITENVKKSIKNVLTELTQTSESLASLSRELTETGHQLAEGTTEQAASIQETSSTLEESSSMVHQTTQNTKEANSLAKQSKFSADKGNDEMKTMLNSMEELKRSSDEIAKIIKIIDEIAFQTNILSLNAAVEAARAGDAGKGFAVVAEEVRNLAQRSAEAAKGTEKIIESNIELSEKCLKISAVVGTSLEEIGDGTNKVNELLDEITTASQEQEIGITQINKAISQMESVLQANASTAQESASSADSLTKYTDTIKNIMLQLKFLIDGGNSDIGIQRTVKSPLIPIASRKSNNTATIAKERIKKDFKAKNTEKKFEAKKEEPKAVYKAPEKPQEKKIEPKKSVKPEDIIPLDDF